MTTSQNAQKIKTMTSCQNAQKIKTMTSCQNAQKKMTIFKVWHMLTKWQVDKK